MKSGNLYNEPYNGKLGRPTFSLKYSAGIAACTVAMLIAVWPSSVTADAPVYGATSPTGLVSPANVLAGQPVTVFRRMSPYRSGMANLEVKQAVIRAAQRHRVQPALLLAVIKAESSFNPIAVSKAGAVGLMQLIPETAIRHGVRNLYDANDNITGGAKHLRYLLDRFHGNTRLALAAYNAGERKVDRYGQIPPYKETQDYVKKVLVYYRSYKQDGWIMPLAIAAPSIHAGKPY